LTTRQTILNIIFQDEGSNNVPTQILYVNENDVPLTSFDLDKSFLKDCYSAKVFLKMLY